MALTLFIACAPGLEPWLAHEASGLEGLAAKPTAEPGGVVIEGGADLVVRANVRLGLASHVLVRIDTLAAKHFGEFERKLARIDWPAWIRSGAPWRVEAVSRRSKLYHTGAIAERIERVVREVSGSGPVDDPDALVVRARFVRDRCTLSLDTSGVPLHRRGWRQQTAKAPLREDLARVLLLASGWSPGDHLIDPMMGSGTILIEAATMVRGWAPGRLRGFAGQHWPGWSSSLEAELRQVASASASPVGTLWGRDANVGALRAATGNAARAGVEDDLDLGMADITDDAAVWPDFEGKTIIVCNPPYGMRIGRGRDAVAPVFEALGRRVKGMRSPWRLGVMVPERRLLAPMGLRLEPALATVHGGLDVEVMTVDASVEH